MRIALLTTDSREHFRDYANPVATFASAPEALLQGFAALPDCEVHVLSCAQQPMRSQTRIADNIWYHGLHVPKIGWLRTGYQGCIRAVRKKLREIRPDIVHGQGTERDCAVSAVFSGWPNLVTIHGNMRLIAQLNHARPFSFEWLAARLETFTLPRADGVICITSYTRDNAERLAKRICVVPNAVDAGFFELLPEIRPELPPTILCVGAICPRKNQNAFIRALDPLAAEKAFQLVFLGSAPAGLPYSREFIELTAARSWCRHAGFVDRDKLKSHLRGTTLLALPSLEDNCPMVVLEAMAAGVPVVAAKVGGVPDLVEDGRTGLFCDPLDPGSLCKAVAKLLAEPELGRRLAAEAWQRARERFHPTVIARRHLEIYRAVLNSDSASPLWS